MREGSCKTCRAKILWATSRPTDPEKKPGPIPLDPELIDPRLSTGALACVPAPDGTMTCVGRNLLAKDYAAQHGVDEQTARSTIFQLYPWRNAHFASCPDAASHRKNP